MEIYGFSNSLVEQNGDSSSSRTSENDCSVLAVVCFDGCTFCERININSSIHNLRNAICEKWTDLTPMSLEISFVRDMKKNIIETDSELQSLACFCFAKREMTVVLSVSSSLSSSSLVCSKVKGASSSSASGVYSEEPEVYKAVTIVDVLKGVDQVFKGGAVEFRVALLKHCMLNGFRVTLKKNDPLRITTECSLKAETGCMWRVHASRKHKLPKCFVIKKYVSTHTCAASFKDTLNPPMTSQLVKSVVLDMVRDKPLIKPCDISDYFRREFGVTLNYYFAYTGRELALKEIYGDTALSYHQLEWYAQELLKTNPGSHVVLEKELTTNKFQRMFISFSACIRGFKYCRPMLCLDGTFLKGSSGCVLGATGQNGNKGIYPLAIAVVCGETIENWKWFLENLKVAISDDRRLTFLSDRHQGLVVGIPEVFPNSYHAYCLYHLKLNLTSAMSSKNKQRSYVVNLFSKLAYAATFSKFEEVLEQFIEVGGEEATQFLETLGHYEKWANAFFQGNRYGNMCSNLAESFNSWILKERSLPITAMVDKIRTKMMEMMSNRRETSKGWSTVLCPKMEADMAQKLDRGKSWTVVRSMDSKYEVHATRSHVVDLFRRNCSCNKWKIEGFPCAHAFRCIAGDGLNVYSYCERYHHTSAYWDSYAWPIEPISNTDMPFVLPVEPLVIPPDCTKNPGRPRKKRKPNIGSNPKKPITCSRCKTYGHHNRKTCSGPISL